MVSTAPQLSTWTEILACFESGSPSGIAWDRLEKFTGSGFLRSWHHCHKMSPCCARWLQMPRRDLRDGSSWCTRGHATRASRPETHRAAVRVPGTEADGVADAMIEAGSSTRG